MTTGGSVGKALAGDAFEHVGGHVEVGVHGADVVVARKY